MFEFEKLTVYNKSKTFNSEVMKFIADTPEINSTVRNQLRRAAFSIMLNIAEGSSRYTRPSKRNFYVISRGSTFECVAIFDFLKDQKLLSEEQYQKFYQTCEELSRMLYQLVKNLGGVDRSR